MSPKNSLLTAGLTALGLFGFAPLGVADPAPPPPSGPEATVAPTPSHAVLLLTNGRVYQGTLSQGGTNYFVHTKTGKLPIPKRDVEKLGRSIEDIYQYLLQRLPARDPDEHMKLALWCLTQGMTNEARGQLNEVLVLSPRNTRALAMLDKIGNAEERASHRDPEVTQAKAEVVAGRPDGFDSAMINRAQRELGILGLTQIPGLPKALATKRFVEFQRFVDPLLQNRCAKCHNEQFDGSFQLVKYQTKADKTVDAYRANLDSVLALIDLENPAKSELLSTTLRPHGGGNHPRPIFRGSNDREYQVLATWVNSLRVKPTTVAAGQGTRFGTPAPASTSGEGFATARGNQMPLPTLTPTPMPGYESAVGPGAVLPPDQTQPDYPPSAHPDVAPGASFPTPFAVTGGAPPTASTPPGMRAEPISAQMQAEALRQAQAHIQAQNMKLGQAGLSSLDPETGLPLTPVAIPGAAVAPAPGPAMPPAPGPAMPPAPGQAMPPAVPTTPESTEAAANAPKKPVKFDPSLLEKALINRYSAPASVPASQ